jgi:excisionase family DNA binding protein
MNRNNWHYTDLLSVAEAAELLGVSRVTAHRWIEKGKLTSVKIGSSRFVLKKEIQEICTARDGNDLEARLRNILARRTPGWTFSLVGEPTDRGPNTMVAIGPDGERIVFRIEIVEESGGASQNK